MATIDLTNYATSLRPSTQGRSGTPDGNIYFNTSTGEVEIITASELATLDMTSYGGGATDANPLTDQDGVKMEALYAFEKQERRNSAILGEDLRQYDKFFGGSFKFAGAYEIINSRKFASNDRDKVRGSGWIERAADGGVDRIYFGGRSLGNVEALSQPYYQVGNGSSPNSYTPVDFAKDGAVDEAVQVFGDTSNVPSDSGAGNFDNRAYYAMSVRTYGQNPSRKTLVDSGLAQSDGYSSGFAIDETPHLTTSEASFPIADAYSGGGNVFPGTNSMNGLQLVKVAVAETETGFAQADGDFSWHLRNPNNLSLNACIAFLDAISTLDVDIDNGSETVTYGKRVDTWYTYDAQGRIVTRSGAGDGLGLYIEAVPAADDQRIVQTDDAGNAKTYPFYPAVEIEVGANALADTNAWYHVYYLDGATDQDFNAANAVTVNDKDGNPVKGDVTTDQVGGKIIFQYDYSANTQAGLSSGVDKTIVIEVEGDGTATAAKTQAIIREIATNSFTCAPGLETNV